MIANGDGPSTFMECALCDEALDNGSDHAAPAVAHRAVRNSRTYTVCPACAERNLASFGAWTGNEEGGSLRRDPSGSQHLKEDEAFIRGDIGPLLESSTGGEIQTVGAGAEPITKRRSRSSNIPRRRLNSADIVAGERQTLRASRLRTSTDACTDAAIGSEHGEGGWARASSPGGSIVSSVARATDDAGAGNSEGKRFLSRIESIFTEGTAKSVVGAETRDESLSSIESTPALIAAPSVPPVLDPSVARRLTEAAATSSSRMENRLPVDKYTPLEYIAASGACVFDQSALRVVIKPKVVANERKTSNKEAAEELMERDPSFGSIHGESVARSKPAVTTACSGSTTRETFADKFAQLQAYKEEHGDCLVDTRKCALGRWVKKQRELHKLSILNKDHERLLESVGFAWSARDQSNSWAVRFDELKAYQKTHGHCLVPQNCPDKPALGEWVANQRRQFTRLLKGQRSTLSRERVVKLEKLGFVWNKRKQIEFDSDLLFATRKKDDS